MLTDPRRTKIGDLKIYRWINVFGFLLSMALLTGVLVGYLRGAWSTKFAAEGFCLGLLFFSGTATLFGLRAWRSHRQIVEDVSEAEGELGKRR